MTEPTAKPQADVPVPAGKAIEVAPAKIEFADKREVTLPPTDPVVATMFPSYVQFVFGRNIRDASGLHECALTSIAAQGTLTDANGKSLGERTEQLRRAIDGELDTPLSLSVEPLVEDLRAAKTMQDLALAIVRHVTAEMLS